MYGQMTRKERWGKFCSGPVSEPALSEKRTGGFAEASYWIKQHYFSPLAIFLSGGVGLFFGYFQCLFSSIQVEF